MTWLRRLSIMYFGVKNTLIKSMNIMVLLCIKIVGAQVNILEDKYLYLETCGNPLWIWWYELSKAIAHKITFSLCCSRASPSIPSFSPLHSELCFSTESFQQMYSTASFLQSQNSIKNEINALLLPLLSFTIDHLKSHHTWLSSISFLLFSFLSSQPRFHSLILHHSCSCWAHQWLLYWVNGRIPRTLDLQVFSIVVTSLWKPHLVFLLTLWLLLLRLLHLYILYCLQVLFFVLFAPSSHIPLGVCPDSHHLYVQFICSYIYFQPSLSSNIHHYSESPYGGPTDISKFTSPHLKSHSSVSSPFLTYYSESLPRFS